jgi:hypothetical protein
MTVYCVILQNIAITKLSSDNTAPDPKEFKKVEIEDRETNVHFNFFPSTQRWVLGNQV